ncbi:MAG: hypothetical protein K6357_07695 [Elusimicrobiota bacterium]
MKKKLFICGYGLKPEEITLQTLHIIKNSDIVLSDALNKKDALKLGLKKFENIRKNTPSQIVEIIKEKFAHYDNISFITYGNPAFLNSVTDEIFTKLKGFEILLIPAVSSLDGIFSVFLELNLLKNDLLIINIPKDPEDINFNLNSDINTLIFGAENLSNKKISKFFKKIFNSTYGKKYSFYITHIKDISFETEIIKTNINCFHKFINEKKMLTIYIPEK